METPGRALIERRSELGYSQDHLAKIAQVSDRTIHNLETGKRWPLPANRAKIERALGWAQGSLDAIRNGGSPTELTDTPTPHTTTNDTTASTPDNLASTPTPPTATVASLNELDGIREALNDIGETATGRVADIVRKEAWEHFSELFDALDDAARAKILHSAYRLLDNGREVDPVWASYFDTKKPSEDEANR